MTKIISIKINKIFKNNSDIQNGLMFVKRLPKNVGALFCMPDKKNHPFWMKNTYVSLDIIFLDEKFKVVGFAENARPNDLTFVEINKPSKFIIEINAGFSKTHSLHVGDLINPVYLKPSLLRVVRTKKKRKSTIRAKTKTQRKLKR